MGCTKLGQECDLRSHQTFWVEYWVFRESPTEIPKWSSYSSYLTRGATGRPDPEGPRRGLGGTRAPTRPPRPRLLRRRTAGQVAALGIPFFLGVTGGNKSRELGCGRGPQPGRCGCQGPQDRAAQRPGRARAEPDPDPPEPGGCRLPFPSRPRRQRQPRPRGPPPSLRARRPASPGLAHATLADDEDLQGGQHVLVHPDPTPLRAQQLGSASQPFTRKSYPRMRAAPRLPPFWFGLQEPGRPISALR